MQVRCNSVAPERWRRLGGVRHEGTIRRAALAEWLA